jgi:cell division protein FtsW
MKIFFLKLHGDKKIWYILFILAAISILAVYSGTYRQAMSVGNLTSVITRHAGLLLLGFAIIYFMHRLPLEVFKKLSPVALLFIVFCLILVLVTSSEETKRWLFSRSFQPSDFAKLIMVVYISKALSDGFRGGVKEFLLRTIAPIALVCLLIINAHTSTTLIIGCTSMILVFMGASKWKYIIVSILFVCLAGLMYAGFHKSLGRGQTASNRVAQSWIGKTVSGVFSSKSEAGEANSADAKKTGANNREYREAKILNYAVVSGGLFGKMPGRSVYRKTLAAAHSDYIYAIIIEEYGLILGGMGIIILYLMLFHRVLLVIKKCTRTFSALLLSGLLILIIMQTFIHIGVSVGGLPITGQNLPMISTGGSSIVVTCMAFGMILSASRKIEENKGRESTE